MFDCSFVDWDNTLYDTVLFKSDIFAIFSEYNVAPDDARAAFKKSLCTFSSFIYDYSFEEHVRFTREMGYALPAEIISKLESLFFKDYIFTDAILFLQWLKQCSKKIILLSAGDVDFQMKKIQHSSVAAYFDEMRIVPGNKEKIIDEYKQNCISFINDNLHENTVVKQVFPSAMVITKFNPDKYTEQEVRDAALPYFKTLTEIKQYVEQQIT